MWRRVYSTALTLTIASLLKQVSARAVFGRAAMVHSGGGAIFNGNVTLNRAPLRSAATRVTAHSWRWRRPSHAARSLYGGKGCPGFGGAIYNDRTPRSITTARSPVTTRPRGRRCLMAGCRRSVGGVYNLKNMTVTAALQRECPASAVWASTADLGERCGVKRCRRPVSQGGASTIRNTIIAGMHATRVGTTSWRLPSSVHLIGITTAAAATADPTSRHVALAHPMPGSVQTWRPHDTMRY